MKRIIVISLLVLLSACEETPKIRPFDPVPTTMMPDGLKDCTFYRLHTDIGPDLTVVRCPNSSTTAVTSEKNPVNTTTVEDTSSERQHKVDELLKNIDAEIARLEQLKN